MREHYPTADLYFAVFGAMTKSRDLRVTSFDDLTGAKIMHAADLEAVFIAATRSPPGIEPPLELRWLTKKAFSQRPNRTPSPTSRRTSPASYVG